MSTVSSKPDVERAIVSLMIGDKDACLRAVAVLNSEMFTDIPCQLIFNASTSLVSTGKDVNVHSLAEEVNKLNGSRLVDIASFIPDPVYTEAKLRTLVKILKDNYHHRKRISIVEEILQDGYKSQDTERFLRESETLFWSSTADRGVDTGLVSSGAMFQTRRKIMIERQSITPIMTYYPELDGHLVGGCFAPGLVSVIAGRPGMGKSALKSNLIYNLCTNGIGVVSVAIEQTLATEMDRIDTLITGIPTTEIRNSRLWGADDQRVESIKNAQHTIDDKWNYHIIHKRGMTLQNIYVILQQIQTRRPVNVVFFDLFDKLIDVNVSLNKPQTVGKKLGEIAIMAQELNAHMCLLVQIHREVEKRKDRRPSMADLKDSGSYEEVARWILGLYRDKYYNPENISDILEVNVLKQNDGPSNVKVDFEFIPEQGRIVEMGSLSRVYRDVQ